MRTFQVTIQSLEYNPISRKHEFKTYEGTFNAKTERGVKTIAKREYANLLDTTKEEIEIISIVEI